MVSTDFVSNLCIQTNAKKQQTGWIKMQIHFLTLEIRNTQKTKVHKVETCFVTFCCAKTRFCFLFCFYIQEHVLCECLLLRVKRYTFTRVVLQQHCIMGTEVSKSSQSNPVCIITSGLSIISLFVYFFCTHFAHTGQEHSVLSLQLK